MEKNSYKSEQYSLRLRFISYGFQSPESYKIPVLWSLTTAPLNKSFFFWKAKKEYLCLMGALLFQRSRRLVFTFLIAFLPTFSLMFEN